MRVARSGMARAAKQQGPNEWATQITKRSDMNLQLRLGTEANGVEVADILIQARAAFMSYAPLAYSESDFRAWVANELLQSLRDPAGAHAIFGE